MRIRKLEEGLCLKYNIIQNYSICYGCLLAFIGNEESAENQNRDLLRVGVLRIEIKIESSSFPMNKINYYVHKRKGGVFFGHVEYLLFPILFLFFFDFLFLFLI